MRFISSSRTPFRAAVFTLAALAATHAPAADRLGANADALASEIASAGRLPAAPAGVVDLKFSDLYVSPVGPRGLELTGKAKSLGGKRVRLLGYMVEQDALTPGVMILAPFKLSTHESEYGLCDDLPPAVVFVSVSKYRDASVPFTPGPLLLTGRLELGRRVIGPDERTGFVHLVLDADLPAAAR